MEKPHEFAPGGRHHDHVEEDDCCCYCGEGEAHENHKDESGEPYFDTDTAADRMRFNGSVAPRITPVGPENGS
jgi:hypothetical protein